MGPPPSAGGARSWSSTRSSCATATTRAWSPPSGTSSSTCAGSTRSATWFSRSPCASIRSAGSWCDATPRAGSSNARCSAIAPRCSPGAVPFGLARALVQASRPEQAAIAHLGAGSLGKLRLRIELLLSYAEKRPVDDVTRGASALLLVCVVAGLAVTLPHVASTSPLDALHLGVERVAAAFLN